MFWFKRKPHLKDYASNVSRLANRLGVERRFSPRVLCPLKPNMLLPAVSYQGHELKLKNISVGGCCLLDPNEFLGPSVGQQIVLNLHWPDGSAADVQSRIASSVDQRRHIQFLDLPADRTAVIQKTIKPGVHGEAMRVVLTGDPEGPLMQAREVWSSLRGDSVVIESAVHRLAEISFDRERYTFYKEAWPTKNQAQISEIEFASLIIFLHNIPQPTDLLEAFIEILETMAVRGRP